MIEEPVPFRLCSNRPQIRPVNDDRWYKRIRFKFTARHNPHPQRVNHLYGLHNVPICRVNDKPKVLRETFHDAAYDTEPEFLRTNTLTGLTLPRFRDVPKRERAVPQLGIVPVSEVWRRELTALTECALSPLLQSEEKTQDPLKPFAEYHPYPINRPVTAIMSKDSIPKVDFDCILTNRERLRTSRPKFTPVPPIDFAKQFWDESLNNDYESQVFALLGQLLHCNDVEGIKKWLGTATDREKGIVLGIIQSIFEARFKQDDLKDIKEFAMRDTETQTEDKEGYSNNLLVCDDIPNPPLTPLNRPKTQTSKIRPQTHPTSSRCSTAESRQSSVILRYKTASKERLNTADSYLETNETSKLEPIHDTGTNCLVLDPIVE